MPVILVVEDDAFIREVAVMLVKDWGYTVLAAKDFESALIELRLPQPIDLLFTDIYLKSAVFGGCDLAREAMAMRPHLRVLYTTGNSATEKLKAQFVDGSQFMRKPYTPLELESAFKSLLTVSH